MHELEVRMFHVCNFTFACIFLGLTCLTAFCMQKMLKIPQTVEEVSFLKQTVSTLSLLFLILV